MRFIRIGLVTIVSLVLVALLCPVVQANSDNTTVDLTAKSIAVPPTVTTAPATGVGRTVATLNGALTDLGTASSVAVSFDWGTTTGYGRETTARAMTAIGSFTATLTGLSPSTSYHFRAKAVGDGVGYGIDRTFTTATPPPSEEGPPPPPPPAGTTDVRGVVSTAGRFVEPVAALSEDGLCTLNIPEGTIGLTEELEPLDEISMLIMPEPPPPPEDAHVIGLAYDFQPSGATFDPAITLTFSYDPSDIPEGIAEEDLVLAFYDEATGEWVELEGCVVDTENNTITAPVSHFTTFAIIGAVPPPPPLPAAFSVTNLSVQPATAKPLETVTISVSVANTGGTGGSYSVVLKINGVKEAEKSITVAAGESQEVSFTVAKEEAGGYSVVVDGLTGSFIVAPPEEEVVPPPEEVVPAPAKPINWPLLGGIIGGVVVVGVGIFFLIRRKAA